MKPTTDDVLKWAREAGATRDHPVHLPNLWTIDTEGFQQLVALAYSAGAAAMKERCAKECEDSINNIGDGAIIGDLQRTVGINVCTNLARAIRALGDDE